MANAVYLNVIEILWTDLFVTPMDTAVAHHSFNIRSPQDAACSKYRIWRSYIPVFILTFWI
jgi:hypothetical protein